MILSLDIGATSVKTGIFDSPVEDFLLAKNFKTEKKFNDFKKLINTILEIYLKKFKFSKIAIGFPGNITKRGDIIFSPNLPFLKEKNIFNLIDNSEDYTIRFENDANCAALGSYIIFKKNDIITLTLGSGIGGGVILNGSLLTNTRNIGFEFGHITVEENGYQCSCGKSGCMEAYSSSNGMIKIYEKISNEKVKDFKGLFAAMTYNNLAKNVIEKGFHYLGVGCSIIVNIFAPELLVFTGGISNKFNNFKKHFFNSFNKYTLPFIRNKVEVKVYTDKNLGLIGAAGLFL